LIVITTNEERDLPAAFLRRCIVLSLAPDAGYAAWLVSRARPTSVCWRVKGRDQALLDDDVLWKAAEQL
jgi:MoxR-like ATPase